jgi:hypothetical protein
VKDSREIKKELSLSKNGKPAQKINRYNTQNYGSEEKKTEPSN